MLTLSTKVTLFTVPTIHVTQKTDFLVSSRNQLSEFSSCYFNINSCDIHIDL